MTIVAGCWFPRDESTTTTTTTTITNKGQDDEKVYFLGKLLWAKGLDRLLDLQEFYRKVTGNYFAMDIYGSGPEEKDIKRAFIGRGTRIKQDEEESSASTLTPPPPSKSEQDLATFLKKSKAKLDLPKSVHELRRTAVPARFMGRIDHASLTRGYKIFVNPSVTEVLCTATAEAIAMGKFAIIPNHESNRFFSTFDNCLQYRNKIEFVSHVQYALANDPIPLSDEQRHRLSWEAASERCIRAAAVSQRDAVIRERYGHARGDEMLAHFHYELLKGPKGDVIRKVLGAGPVSQQSQFVVPTTTTTTTTTT
mmetsp:Transcript_4002/g.5989  ORF Transcript_4002/g.5989 Transcript_4002/m.5989 type:complete len:309 (-) Transcript_4002:19-945(-)